MKSIKERAIKKRAKNVKHSKATKTERERTKSDKKEKLETRTQAFKSPKPMLELETKIL